MIEFAFVLPILILILVFAVDGTRMFTVQMGLEELGASAARYSASVAQTALTDPSSSKGTDAATGTDFDSGDYTHHPNADKDSPMSPLTSDTDDGKSEVIGYETTNVVPGCDELYGGCRKGEHYDVVGQHYTGATSTDGDGKKQADSEEFVFHPVDGISLVESLTGEANDDPDKNGNGKVNFTVNYDSSESDTETISYAVISDSSDPNKGDLYERPYQLITIPEKQQYVVVTAHADFHSAFHGLYQMIGIVDVGYDSSAVSPADSAGEDTGITITSSPYAVWFDATTTESIFSSVEQEAKSNWQIGADGQPVPLGYSPYEGIFVKNG